MFLYEDFLSVNKSSDLATGVYRGVCTTFVDRKTAEIAVFTEYTRDGDLVAVVAELQLVTSVGDVLFCDFWRMPDRTWRDSHGLRAYSIGELLPPGMTHYAFFEQYKLPEISVEGGND